RLVGADASHAWCAVYAGNGEWIDCDPTTTTLCSTDHLTLAWGRDYSDVPPVTGVCVGGSQHRLSVSVDVLPLEQ
ncbi:MAG: transglutaminase family protein, partial [Planctomyces sp.]